MKILNFGSCNIDYVYDVQHIVIPGETLSVSKSVRFPGGKGLNQSIAIAKSGFKVYHAGCIGNDGVLLKKTLESANVDISYLKIVNEITGHAIIQVDKKGQNSILLYGGANKAIDRDFVDKVLKDFESKDILVLQNEISNIAYIIDKAYQQGMCIILNPSPYEEIFEKIDLSKINYIILNEIEAYGMSQKKDVDSIYQYFRQSYPNLKVVLTLGIDGSVYFDKEEYIRYPAFSVDAVDTTAAGDTFLGYFVSCVAHKIHKKEALKISSAAAALAVMKKGASVSIPTIKEVNEFLIKNNLM